EPQSITVILFVGRTRPRRKLAILVNRWSAAARGHTSERARVDVSGGNCSMPGRALGTACKPATLGSLPETRNAKALQPSACRAYCFWLRGQDLNLRPSGYEAPDEGLQEASERTNPRESLDSMTDGSAPPMQAESDQHKNFGQPVVSEHPARLDDGCHAESLLIPAQAAAQFHIPEYLLRRACSEGRLEHLRVVNALWLTPAAVPAFP